MDNQYREYRVSFIKKTADLVKQRAKELGVSELDFIKLAIVRALTSPVSEEIQEKENK